MELQTNPHNPRTISKDAYEKLKRSIERNPDGLTANKIAHKDGIIISGNQRYRAIQELKLDMKPEWFKDLSGWTPEQIDEWVIQSNISAGEWDWDELANSWDADALLEWGIDMPDEWGDTKELPDDIDDIPTTPKTPITKLGDLWLLGNHRVLCGDSTDKTTVERLVDGKKADMVFTDPPYGIDADKMTMGSGKKDFHRGEWDSEVPKISWLLDQAQYVCIWGGNYFVDQLPITNDWLCWHKKNDGLSFSEFELAWTNYGKNCRHLSHHWGGEKKQHVTMKPVQVCVWGMELVDAKTVFDPFLGSGSTLIACEQTDRICYGMELDPLYVDVICKRWQTLTGQMPILESTGEAHDFMVQ